MPRSCILASIALLTELLTGTGCLVRMVNKHWPPREPEASQLQTIQAANDKLQTLPRVDVYASVSKADLKAALPPILKTIPGIQNVDVDTGLQELTALVDFDKDFDYTSGSKTGTVRLVGRATVNAPMYVDGQDLVISKPSFSTVKLKRIVVKKQLPGIVVDIINKLLAGFLDNINGQLKDQKISIKFAAFESLTPASVLQQIQGLSNISGSPVNLSVAFDQGAVLIDKAAVHAIAKLQENGVRLDQSQSERRAIDQPPPTPVEQAFAQYQTAFVALSERDLGPLSQGDAWNSTSAAIAKTFVGALVDKSFANLDTAASFTLPDTDKQPFSSEIHADQAPDLNCDQNAANTSCDIQMDCSQNRDCNPHWDCPSCAWYDLGCDARRVACEVDKGRYRGQCELEKKAAQDGCELDKSRMRAQCEIGKAVTQATCHVNQDWLNAFSGAHFADVSGDARLTNIESTVTLSKIAVPSDLSSIVVNSSVEAQANVNANFQFTPLDLGHLLCQFPWGGPVNFKIGLPYQTLQLSAQLQATPEAGDALNLHFTTASQDLTLKTSTPPILALVGQNPQSLIVCAPAVSLGLGAFTFVKKVREDLLNDTFHFTIPSQEFNTTIQPISINVVGMNRKLRPLWREKSVGFVEVPPEP